MLNKEEAALHNRKVALRRESQLLDRLENPPEPGRTATKRVMMLVDPASRPWKRPPRVAKVRVKSANVRSNFGSVRVDTSINLWK